LGYSITLRLEVVITNQRTKFDVPGFIRPKDRTGTPKRIVTTIIGE